jgi:hypothetical protein
VLQELIRLEVAIIEVRSDEVWEFAAPIFSGVPTFGAGRMRTRRLSGGARSSSIPRTTGTAPGGQQNYYYAYLMQEPALEDVPPSPKRGTVIGIASP